MSRAPKSSAEEPAGTASRPPASRRPTVVTRDGSRWWRYGFWVVAAVLLVNALAGERGYLEYRRLEARQAEARAQLAARRAENEALQRSIRQLKTDPAAVEREIRAQLGYARRGEVVFTIRDAPPPAPASPPAR